MGKEVKSMEKEAETRHYSAGGCDDDYYDYDECLLETFGGPTMDINNPSERDLDFYHNAYQEGIAATKETKKIKWKDVVADSSNFRIRFNEGRQFCLDRLKIELKHVRTRFKEKTGRDTFKGKDVFEAFFGRASRITVFFTRALECDYFEFLHFVETLFVTSAY